MLIAFVIQNPQIVPQDKLLLLKQAEYILMEIKKQEIPSVGSSEPIVEPKVEVKNIDPKTAPKKIKTTIEPQTAGA